MASAVATSHRLAQALNRSVAKNESLMRRLGSTAAERQKNVERRMEVGLNMLIGGGGGAFLDAGIQILHPDFLETGFPTSFAAAALLGGYAFYGGKFEDAASLITAGLLSAEGSRQLQAAARNLLA